MEDGVERVEVVRALGDLAIEERQQAGGKGGTLARLHQAGYPVPEGFVVLPEAFDGDALTPGAWEQVKAYLDRLRSGGTGVSFAIRSSALNEDSAQASFAGEFETVLDVQSDDEVRAAVETVHGSRHAERVEAYSRAHDLGAIQEMAVVVQRLVHAELSGVLFTADPVAGNRKTMTGNYVCGLGDKLVSGKVNPLAFTLGRPDGAYEGPPELERHAKGLYGLAVGVERELGSPQDIEWAVVGRKLHLLQSRPITTLGKLDPFSDRWNDSLEGDFLWSNVNFGEAVSEVMTPLSWSVLELTLEEWTIIPGHHPAGNIGGIPYLNLSTFASVYAAMGRSGQGLLEALEGTVYTRLPEGLEIPLVPLTKRSLISVLLGVARLQLGMRQAMRGLPAYVETNPLWCKRMRQAIQESTPAQLIALWEKEIEPHVRRSVLTVLGSASYSADYTTGLRRKLTPLVGPDDAATLTSSLSGDGALLACLGPVVGLARVARGELDGGEYLDQYGHRGPEEFELSARRPAEDPEWLDHQLARFDETTADLESMLAAQRDEFEAAWQRFETGHPWKARSMRRRIDQVAPRAQLREAARSEYARDRWVVREFALRAGEETGLGDGIFFLTVAEMLDVLRGDLEAADHISTRRETYEEYRALPAYPPVIIGSFEPFQWAADPDRRTDLFDSRAGAGASMLSASARGSINGSPGSAGRVEGMVRRLARLEEGDQLQEGEILLTAQTNIGWTFLFPRTAAIITDVGAPLSHAAIVARELGIPAVVGCGNATMRLKTGDRVRVDGGRGVVEILERA
jgi:phosphohistidine swiveling domain-containing protein